MTIGGWIFMVCSIGFVVWLVSFCYYRVLSGPSAAERMQAPPGTDTHDRDT